MRKHYYHAPIFRLITALSLCLVMLSINVSGYFSDSTASRTEWQKVVLTAAVVGDEYVIRDMHVVPELVNQNMTSEGVIPEVAARCRSPGVAHYQI